MNKDILVSVVEKNNYSDKSSGRSDAKTNEQNDWLAAGSGGANTNANASANASVNANANASVNANANTRANANAKSNSGADTAEYSGADSFAKANGRPDYKADGATDASAHGSARKAPNNRTDARANGRFETSVDNWVEIKADTKAEQKYDRIIRMAVVSGGELLDYAVSDSGSASNVGNIYKGFVTNVFPGTQSCFVNIGLERNAVLYAADLTPQTGTYNKRPIETLVRTGQKIIVQVLRDATGEKGAHVTTKLALPGKYAVLLPNSTQCAVSRRIIDPRESARLRDIAKKHLMTGNGQMARTGAVGESARTSDATQTHPTSSYGLIMRTESVGESARTSDATQKHPTSGYGLIMRTESVGASEAKIAADIAALSERLSNMRRNEMSDKIPDCIHAETDFYRELLFRMLDEEVTRVITDDKVAYRELLKRASAYNPDIAYKISHYREPWPLFAFHGVQNDVNNLQARKVWLKCGAFIVIDRTEAMTVIDVNTGKYSGANQRETFMRVNTEAVIEAARQLRLRDVGGIVIIDTLRMSNQADQRTILDAFNAELAKDRQKTAVMGFSKLGLLEMTRKRTRVGLYPTAKSEAAAPSAANIDEEWRDEGIDRLFNVNIDDY